MITPKEIEKETMTEAKRDEAKKSLFGFYFGRPITYVLTVPFLYTNISPNIVTLISILFSIAGYVILSFGDSVGQRLIGLLMFFLWSMGDGIDGNIARYKKQMSSNGDLLDTLGGYMALSLILLSMGNAAFVDTEGHVYFSRLFPVAIAGLSVVFALIPRLLMHRKIANDKCSTFAISLKDKQKYSLAKLIVLNICDPAGFQEVFMLVAIMGHYCAEFTIAYCIINIIVMCYSIIKLLE